MAVVPPRMVTVWVADWPVVAAGCRPDVAAAIVRANRVVARTPAAAADGVAIGQRRRQAQQRCPQIDLLDDDPARDAREFESVVQLVADMAPRVDVVEPGWLSLAARGPSRYFGGDDALAERLAASVAERVPGAVVGVGVADGRFAASVAARLAARRRRPLVVPTGGSARFCGGLPVGWLQTTGEADAEFVDLLTRLGIRRLGDLAALDPGDVVGRFGPIGRQAQRLAAGLDDRPPSTLDPPVERRVDRLIDDPSAQSEAVVFVAKQLADQLVAGLAADGRVCTRLVVQLETEHGERSERSWYRAAGLSASAMVERVRWQVEAWVAQPRGMPDEITAGVALVRLIPDEVRADVGVQLGLWGGQSDADHRAIRAIARLTTLASESSVTVPVWCGGRLPHERYRWVPAATADLDDRRSAVVAADGPWPGVVPSPSPSTVLSEPVPIEVVDASGAAVQVTGRGLVVAPPASFRCGDLTWSVRAWAGPWPVDQRWWEPSAHRRLARFQVVVERGGVERAHLIAVEHRRWWLLATYD